MKFKTIKNRLWYTVFVKVAAIFAAFVIILTLSNVTLLVKFFEFKEKNSLYDRLDTVSQIDLKNENEVRNSLSSINEKYNFDVEIYNRQGMILYTTHGGQMMDYFGQNNPVFKMSHEELQVIESESLGNGITFKKAVRSFDNSEYLLCQKEISKGIFAEVRIRMQLIVNSATIANEFIVIVSLICLALSIIWVLIFAKQFSRPISEMNRITKQMARLNFEEKLKDAGENEIGELSQSINELSYSLSAALGDLKEKNKKLEADIEAERRLDSMRKAFIANVSHELKTPISIINGYAEGLKLDVNPASREAYCDTIINEGNRMNRLVLSILQLSKYESGQIPLNLNATDVFAISNQLLNKIFKGKNIRFKCNVPDNTLVLADSLQIEQVLTALLENAVVHTPENGEVTVSSSGEDIVRICVTNTGEHIEPEKMSQIWQSFYRGDTSHKRDNTRFGLGLSIVSAIIKMHNSSCGVYNTDDGVCFWFELKRYREDLTQ